MKFNAEKTKEFFNRNLTRLLVIAVILSSCFSFKTAVLGKYYKSLYDYSSVTAGDMYFSSNVLAENDVLNTVNTFTGGKYVADFEIRAYDNAFYYNKAGRDIMYYLVVQFYTDSSFTTVDTVDKRLPSRISVSMGENNSQMLNAYYYPSKDSEFEQKNGFPAQYGKNYHIGLLKGKDEYQRFGLQQMVRVTLEWATPQTDPLYMKIGVRTITPDNANPERVKGLTDEQREAYMQQTGLYDKILEAKYILNKQTNTTGEKVKTQLKTSDSYSVEYQLSSETNSQVLIAFDPDYLIYQVPSEQIKDDSYHGRPIYYVPVEVVSLQAKTFYFYKTHYSDKIYEAVTEEEKAGNTDPKKVIFLLNTEDLDSKSKWTPPAQEGSESGQQPEPQAGE